MTVDKSHEKDFLGHRVKHKKQKVLLSRIKNKIFSSYHTGFRQDKICY